MYTRVATKQMRHAWSWLAIRLQRVVEKSLLCEAVQYQYCVLGTACALLSRSIVSRKEGQLLGLNISDKLPFNISLPEATASKPVVPKLSQSIETSECLGIIKKSVITLRTLLFKSSFAD